MLAVLIGSKEKNSVEAYQTDENRRGYMFSGEMSKALSCFDRTKEKPAG